jgi:hypothetical protein
MSILKNKTLSILLIFTFATALVLTYSSQTVKAVTTLEVPTASYPTIQSALNAAKDGDTIKIASGTYNENINYDGYALAVSSGLSQPKSGITLQGEAGTIINGAVTLLYLKQFKIEGLTVTGDLTLGDCKAYGYLSYSVVSNVQVGSILSIGGPYNTVVDSQVKMLILKGANTKMEFPAYNTNVENNQLRGLAIQAGSHSNTIKGNTIAHGETGISEEPSKTYYTTGNNQFINNTIANNNVGIYLYCSTGGNGAASHSADQLIQNIIRDNAVGLTLSASSQFVVGNIIYHNDFFNNGVQAKINNPVTNVWDDGARKGNYWSDYTGLDSNGDGVGDTPYVINAENSDNYPLMHPYSAPNVPAPTPSVTPSPAPSSANPPQNPSPSPSPTDSIQAQQPSSSPSPTQSISTGANQEQNSVIPELTPIIALVALAAASLGAVIFKRKSSLF